MLLSEVIKHPMDQNGFILSMMENPKDTKDEEDILHMKVKEKEEEVENRT